MGGWHTLDGLAVGLPIEGVDTDQLIPARFMSAPRSEGYGKFLLHDLRFDDQGAPARTFPLNHPKAKGASVLVTQRNFGGGSSREAAVYALADFGIRAVIAPSFGDIFSSNAVNNGVLPARISNEDADTLLKMLKRSPSEITVDLAAESISAGERSFRFGIDAVWKKKIMNGWDDIDLTHAHADEIVAFRDRYRLDRQWAWLAPESESIGAGS